MEDFEHDESPRLVIYNLDIGGPGHGENTDFRTFCRRSTEFAELVRQGHYIEYHFMKGKLGECRGSFNWYFLIYVDQ